MPVGKQGNIGPAIARNIAVDRAGTYFQAKGWMAAGVLPFGMVDAISTQDASGNIVLVGGRSSVGNFNDRVPVHYNVTTQVCTLGQQFPGDRNSQFNAVVLPDGRVLAHGNGQATFFIYDPNTALWTAAAPCAFNKAHGDALVNISGNRVLNAGGTNGQTAIEIYDVASNTWSTHAATYTVAGLASCYGLELGNGSVMLSFAESLNQNVAFWTEAAVGPIAQVNNYFPAGWRFITQGAAERIGAIIKTGDMIIVGDSKNLFMGNNFPFGQGNSVVEIDADGSLGSVIPSAARSLKNSVAAVRPFDNKVIMWDAFADYFTGALQGPVEFFGDSCSPIPKPPNGALAIYAGSSLENIWYVFGGANSGGIGTNNIFSFKT